MTDRGDFILVDSTEIGSEMTDILDAVEKGHRRIQIVRDGKIVAEMAPVGPRILHASDNPNLRVVFSADYDPCEELNDQDWPEHLR